MKRWIFPDQTDLIAWFGSVPENEENIRFTFRTAGKGSVMLRFSFDIVEASVQTVLSIAGTEVTTVVHEGASRLWIEGSHDDGILLGLFERADSKTSLRIELHPRIKVEWSSLIIH